VVMIVVEEKVLMQVKVISMTEYIRFRSFSRDIIELTLGLADGLPLLV